MQGLSFLTLDHFPMFFAEVSLQIQWKLSKAIKTSDEDVTVSILWHEIVDLAKNLGALKVTVMNTQQILS